MLGSFLVHENLRVLQTAVRQSNFVVADTIFRQTDPYARQKYPNATFFAPDGGTLKRLEDRWGCAYVRTWHIGFHRILDETQEEVSERNF